MWYDNASLFSSYAFLRALMRLVSVMMPLNRLKLMQITHLDVTKVVEE